MRAFMGLRHSTNIRWIGLSGARLFQPRILKDRRKRRTTAVRERLHPGRAIVRDESPHGHGLHRMREDADCCMVDARRGAK